MLSEQAPEFCISTVAAFSTGFGLGFLYCTMHPSGSRSFGKIIPPVRRSRGTEISNTYWNPPCSFEPETPVRYCGPRKSSVPSRVQKGSVFMVRCQHCMAHGVVSKDRSLGFISGVERLSNQLHGCSSINSGSPFHPNRIIGTFCPPQILHDLS